MGRPPSSVVVFVRLSGFPVIETLARVACACESRSHKGQYASILNLIHAVSLIWIPAVDLMESGNERSIFCVLLDVITP